MTALDRVIADLSDAPFTWEQQRDLLEDLLRRRHGAHPEIAAAASTEQGFYCTNCKLYWPEPFCDECARNLSPASRASREAGALTKKQEV